MSKLRIAILLATLLVTGPALATDHHWAALNLHFLLPEKAHESQNDPHLFAAQDESGSLSLTIAPASLFEKTPDQMVEQRYKLLTAEKLEKIKVLGKNKLALKGLTNTIWMGNAQTTDALKLGKLSKPKGAEMLWAIVGLRDKCQQGSVLLLRWWSGDANASQDVDRLFRSLAPLNPSARCPEAPQAA